MHCARLAKFAVGAKLAGGGFFAGIPGTVGGALAMNAGAHGGETWDVVREVEVMRRDGTTAWLSKSAFRYGYRHVESPAGVAGFVAAGRRVRRSRYRPDRWRSAELAVAATGLLPAVLTFTVLSDDVMVLHPGVDGPPLVTLAALLTVLVGAGAALAAPPPVLALAVEVPA